jgi:hypothetical protein
MWHIGGKKMHRGFWYERVKERNQWEDLGVDGRMTKFILNKQNESAWTTLTWLRIGASGGLL